MFRNKIDEARELQGCEDNVYVMNSIITGNPEEVSEGSLRMRKIDSSRWILEQYVMNVGQVDKFSDGAGVGWEKVTVLSENSKTSLRDILAKIINIRRGVQLMKHCPDLSKKVAKRLGRY